MEGCGHGRERERVFGDALEPHSPLFKHVLGFVQVFLVPLMSSSDVDDDHPIVLLSLSMEFGGER